MNPRILTVIPARGGSKGVPRKNLRKLGGRPVVAHAVAAALDARLAGAVLVTSDSDEILRAAAVSRRVIALKRPKALAGDRAAILPVYRHAVEAYEKMAGVTVDYMVGLEPTTPFRSADDIDGAIRQALRTGAEVVTTVREAVENPYFLQVEPKAPGASWVRQVKRCKTNRRQDAPKVWTLNGAVYVFTRKALFGLDHIYSSKRLGVYEMPRERSVDLDSEEDFAYAEFLLKRRRR